MDTLQAVAASLPPQCFASTFVVLHAGLAEASITSNTVEVLSLFTHTTDSTFETVNNVQSSPNLANGAVALCKLNTTVSTIGGGVLNCFTFIALD